MTTQQLCRHIICLIHAPVHVYGRDGTFLTVYEDYEEQQDLLLSDDVFCRRLLDRARADTPLLYAEGDAILYGIVWGGEDVYLVGPCCLSQDTAQAARYLQQNHRLDRSQPYSVSTVPLELLAHAALMLVETVSGVSVDVNQLLRVSFCDGQMLEDMQMRIQQAMYDNQEQVTLHNPYQQELREQDSIRTGDLALLTASLQEVYVGRVGRLSADPLRQAKYNAVTVVVLASRSAIQGGLQPELAFSMADTLIRQVDEARNEAVVMAYMRQAEMEYCKAVHSLSAAADAEQPLVAACKTLVMQKLHAKPEVQTLARELGVTPKHLSATFSRQTGTKLKDYITREKLHAAKMRLIYSDDSFDDIAYAYGFASQSHFGRAFKQWEGMTPGQFRKQYGQWEP
ncbi:MAG: helix-turn-helix transcriptional regulator [Clostridiales bacterium]|nr:helix-turn-helix transcriptional regulator [Clostridiales bacterium]